MLFSSSEFIFVFLPLVYAGFLIARRLRLQGAAMGWLVGASLFFYGWWNPRYVVLIVGLIAINFALGRLITGSQSRVAARACLIAGLVINLGALGYFKYANFLLGNVDALIGTHHALAPIMLPLGISFFTFQKIAFLVDAYRGQVKHIGLLEFSLFVLFFPQLIAGPIVHHAEVVPQFAGFGRDRLIADDLVAGVCFFFAGLFKKAVIADNLAAYAVTPAFTLLANGGHPLFLEAWGGVLGYTLQLYFDFSGYSDMAIGAALLFGIRLPLNFNSPYKSASIVEFWRRWHMTLSRFLRDYLYITLGGNRCGTIRRQVNLLVTMLLGGIWHGAGWTFVVWGALHALYLTINHAWRHAVGRLMPHVPATLPGRMLGMLCTFAAVVVGWVFFRADTLSHALLMLRSMAGEGGVQLPASLLHLPGAGLLAAAHARFVEGGAAYGHLRGGAPFVLIGMGLLWVWLLPNTQEVFAQVRDARPASSAVVLRLRYNWACATLTSIVILVSLLYVRSNLAQEFLYFDF